MESEVKSFYARDSASLLPTSQVKVVLATDYDALAAQLAERDDQLRVAMELLAYIRAHARSTDLYNMGLRSDTAERIDSFLIPEGQRTRTNPMPTPKLLTADELDELCAGLHSKVTTCNSLAGHIAALTAQIDGLQFALAQQVAGGQALQYECTRLTAQNEALRGSELAHRLTT